MTESSGTSYSFSSVVVGIVDWNGHERTSSCLDRIASIYGSQLKVIVVDNNSNRPYERGQSVTDMAIQVIRNNQNLGYPAACNQILRWALEHGYPYVLIMNNDVLMTDDFIGQAVKLLEENHDVAAVAPMIDNESRVSRFEIPRHTNLWFLRTQYASGLPKSAKSSERNEIEVQWLSGAAFMARTRVIADIGGFYEPFFLYWEDTDLGMRIRNGGWRLLVITNSIFHHAEGASTTGMSYIPLHFSTRNRYLLSRRHATLLQQLFFFAFITPIELLALPLLDLVLKGNIKYARVRVQAILDGLEGEWGPKEFEHHSRNG